MKHLQISPLFQDTGTIIAIELGFKYRRCRCKVLSHTSPENTKIKEQREQCIRMKSTILKISYIKDLPKQQSSEIVSVNQIFVMKLL